MLIEMVMMMFLHASRRWWYQRGRRFPLGGGIRTAGSDFSQRKIRPSPPSSTLKFPCRYGIGFFFCETKGGIKKNVSRRVTGQSGTTSTCRTRGGVSRDPTWPLWLPFWASKVGVIRLQYKLSPYFSLIYLESKRSVKQYNAKKKLCLLK